MRTATFTVILLSVFALSCKKDEQPPPPQPDNILHTELQTYLEVTAADTAIVHPAGCGTIPFPSDSSASLSFDVNNDGVDDYTIQCDSWYNYVSSLYPCSNYNSVIQLSGTNTNNLVFYTGSHPTAKRYDSTAVINNYYAAHQNGFLLRTGSGVYPWGCDFNGDAYLGIKMIDGNDEYFGWVHLNKTDFLITLKSYALNLTPNNPINAGQIQ